MKLTMKMQACLGACIGCLMLASAASADFVSLYSEAKGTTSVPGAGFWSCNIYARFDSPADRVLRVTDAHLFPKGGAQFYQNPFGAATEPSPALVTVVPDLAFDTFVTIGLKLQGPPGTPVTALEPGSSMTFTGFTGGWTTDPSAPQGLGVQIAGQPGYYVLLMQLTIENPTQLAGVGGNMTLVWKTATGPEQSTVIPPFQHPISPPASLCASGLPPEVITLRSGQVASGGPGAPCAIGVPITYDTTGGLCSIQPLALNFVAAASGLLAEVVAPRPEWLASLPCDPLARWINWNANPADNCWGSPPHSVLYAHPFSVTSPCIEQATLTFCWAVDDSLGDPGGPEPDGVFIGQPGSMTALAVNPVLSGGGAGGAGPFTVSIPPGALVPGNNVLYVYQRNTVCGFSGVIYSATISICPSVCPCLNVSNEKILCPLDDSGCYTYGLSITNKSGLSAKYLTLPGHPIGMPDVTIQPSDINFLTQYGSLLEDGDTASIEVTICGGDPGDQVCFETSLLTEDFEECCFQELCIELPQCDCGQLSCQSIVTPFFFPSAPVNFDFTLDNLSPFPVDEVHFIPANFEQGDFVKDVFDPATPLLPGESLPMSVQISGVEPGDEFCFFVLLQHPGEKTGKDCCCGFEKCITIPEPIGFGGGFGDFTGGCCLPPPQEGCVPSTLGACTALGGSFSFTSCFCTECPQLLLCPVDLNRDDQIDGLDLAVLLGQWTGASVYQPCPPSAPADGNQDCHIDGLDLGMLLSAWGSCE